MIYLASYQLYYIPAETINMECYQSFQENPLHTCVKQELDTLPNISRSPSLILPDYFPITSDDNEMLIAEDENILDKDHVEFDTKDTIQNVKEVNADNMFVRMQKNGIIIKRFVSLKT